MANVRAMAISSSPTKIQQCMKLGAFDSLNYKQIPDYSERVMLMSDHEGMDYIFDPVCAGAFFTTNLNCLGMDSKWVIYGTIGGTKVRELNMMKLLAKRASILTTNLRDKPNDQVARVIKDVENVVVPEIENGKI